MSTTDFKLSCKKNATPILITLLFILTIGLADQFQQRSNAFDLNDLENIQGLSGIELNNNCVAFECNNQQTVNNSKTITGNTNSNIVSESDNTNIRTNDLHGNSSQTPNLPNEPNPPTCLECFERSHLNSFQLDTIFMAYNVQSLEELCEKLQGTSSHDFSSRMGSLGITIDLQCFIDSGIFSS